MLNRKIAIIDRIFVMSGRWGAIKKIGFEVKSYKKKMKLMKQRI